jgi:hypothetical protein
MTTKAEHIAYCKERALEYVDAGDLINAYSSMVSDLNNHPETEGHPAIVVGMGLMVGGHLSTPESMREFINGFN